MSIITLIHHADPPCAKCPYKLGLVHTVVNPCPYCKENDYQTFERFQKQVPEGGSPSERKHKEDDTHKDTCSGCPCFHRIMPYVSDIFYL